MTRDLRALVAQRQAEYERLQAVGLRRRGSPRAGSCWPIVRHRSGAGAPRGGAATRRAAGDRLQRRPRAGPRPRRADSRSSTSISSGEILVAPMTDPGWVFLMVPAGGLSSSAAASSLTRRSSAASSASRPWSAVPNATSLIADGQMVEIDGATGVVRLLD